MERIVLATAVLAVGIVGWGYWDAYHLTEKKGSRVSVEVIDAFSLYFDSMPAFDPYNRGQLFLKVRWTPEADVRIAEVYISASLIENGITLTKVSSSCQRAGSSWLANGKWEFDGYTSTDPICFIKLDKELPVRQENGRFSDQDIEANTRRMRNMHFDQLYARVYVANHPMRFVSSINDWVKTTKERMLYPFQRGK